MAPSAGAFSRLMSQKLDLIKAVWGKISSIGPKYATLPVCVRCSPKNAAERVALLRQSGLRRTTYSSRNRLYHTGSRKFSTSRVRHASSYGPRFDRSKFPASRIRAFLSKYSGRAPFASTLRPNLTGGALSRTAGGYCLGSGRIGGVRFFTHTPSASAEVVQNVSQAVRAFWLSGKRAQFSGIDPRTGEHQFRVVSAAEDKVSQKLINSSILRSSPGSFLDFQINPTITALVPSKDGNQKSFGINSVDSLNANGLLDMLSVDFSRALKDLAAVLNDLKRLSELGDLPITYHTTYIRVHFPGCDYETVERLCEELGIQRGVVGQDEGYDAFVGSEVALLFPFAPSTAPSQCSLFDCDEVLEDSRQLFAMPKKSPTKRCKMKPADYKSVTTISVRSFPQEEDEVNSYEFITDDENAYDTNAWVSSPSGYESISPSALDYANDSYYYGSKKYAPEQTTESAKFEGLYTFLSQCES